MERQDGENGHFVMSGHFGIDITVKTNNAKQNQRQASIGREGGGMSKVLRF